METDNQFFFNEYAKRRAEKLKQRGWGKSAVPFAMFLAKTDKNCLDRYPDCNYWFGIFVATAYDSIKTPQYDSCGDIVRKEPTPGYTEFITYLTKEEGYGSIEYIECNDAAHYLLDKYQKAIQLLTIRDEIESLGGLEDYIGIQDVDL